MLFTLIQSFRIPFIGALCSALFLVAAQSQAQVYSWQDDDGIVHYASKPTDSKAKVAKLPTINRAEVKIVQPRGVTCTKHGGINCQLGADSDGSVICFDGFKDAIARYRFTCNAAKLEVSTISESEQHGGYIIVVRNSKSVAATDIVVSLRGADSKMRTLSGPAEIEPFGSAEYAVPQEGDTEVSKPELSAIELKCGNCTS